MSENPDSPVFVANAPTPEPSSNGLGLAGFITSLVGIFTGGVLSPVGLILSLVALTRRPRGFAIAGVVLGTVGSCGGCILLMLGGAMFLSVIVAVAAGGMPALDSVTHMFEVEQAIQTYVQQHGKPPADLGQLGLSEATLKDGWGHPIQYRVEMGPGPADWNWAIQSPGSDGVVDSSDMTIRGENPDSAGSSP